MKKIFTCTALIMAVRLVGYAQPTPLAEQAGVKVAYEATKLEEDKKHDKWKIDITVDNDAPQDVVYLGAMIFDPISKTSSAPKYLKIEVTNSKGLFTTNFIEFQGEPTPFLAGDGSNIFRASKGRRTESF